MAAELKHKLDRDMSAQGIARRLRRLSELHALALSLKKAKPLSVAEPRSAYGQKGAIARGFPG
ncbi:MAG: hypothetical protein EOL90_02570 [Spartobacteria bacterium]|nr:hypothetical protein [Spartobacteria bacterium]